MAFVLRRAGSIRPTFVRFRKTLRCSSVSERLGLPQCRSISASCCRTSVKSNEHVARTLEDSRTRPSLYINYPNSKDYSADKLFSDVNEKVFGQDEAVKLLKYLSDLTIQGHIKTDSYVHDARFLKFLQKLQLKLREFTNANVIKALGSMLRMELDPENKTVQYFENEVLWRMRKMNFKALSICLQLHCDYKETEMQMSVVSALISAMKSRWVEISDADDVIKNLEKAHLFDEEFLHHLEERALLIVEKMSPEELHKVCLALSTGQRRPLALLRSISYHFTKCTVKLTAKQTISMFHCLHALRFVDQSILQKLSGDLLPEIPTLKGNSIFILLMTIGQLRWRYPAILDACCEWIENNANSCRTQEIVSCVLTLAAVDYHPAEEEKLFSIILPKLSRKLVNMDAVWLDVVLSLAILGRVTSEHLSSVLNPSFYGTLCESSVQDTTGNVLRKLKILNVNAVAMIERRFSKCLLDIGHTWNNMQIPLSKLSQECQETVITSLSNYLPRGKFMATNLNTSLGFLIDAEFILDKQGKPLPIAQFGVKAGIDNDLKPLPVGCNRIALLIWHFNDFTHHTSSLIGKNALAVRLLKEIGYKVIEIPYVEFQEYKTVVKQVQYLQQMINDKLKEPVPRDRG